jgi:hypothetical protein
MAAVEAVRLTAGKAASVRALAAALLTAKSVL